MNETAGALRGVELTAVTAPATPSVALSLMSRGPQRNLVGGGTILRAGERTEAAPIYAGSRSSSGQRDMPTASPRPTSPDPVDPRRAGPHPGDGRYTGEGGPLEKHSRWQCRRRCLSLRGL